MLITIKQNAKNNYVKIAQYLTGYAARNQASGIFDAKFKEYVCEWQRQNGLTADGIIGPKSWNAMVEKAPMCSTARNKTSAYTCALQLLLGGVTVDGIFGSSTKSAVFSYQNSKGLTADGICGRKTWGSLILGETVSTVNKISEFKQPKDFKQYDSKWASKMYSSVNDKSQTMKSSGCGPTAAADVVATLKDSSVTPWTLAQLYLKKGFRSANNGTNWSAFKWTANQYGFSKFVQTSNIATLKACIDAGGYVVCSMGPGYWTSGGHYICAWKYESGYIYCNDPASAKRTKQKESDFIKQRKQFFCFYP